MVWLPVFPPIPATMGIKVAKATNWEMVCSNTPITREATKAVHKLIASHVQRVLTACPTGANTSSSGLNPHTTNVGIALFMHIIDDIFNG